MSIRGLFVRLIVVSALAGPIAISVGCGGGGTYSKAEIMRAAMRRKKALDNEKAEQPESGEAPAPESEPPPTPPPADPPPADPPPAPAPAPATPQVATPPVAAPPTTQPPAPAEPTTTEPAEAALPATTDPTPTSGPVEMASVPENRLRPPHLQPQSTESAVNVEEEQADSEAIELPSYLAPVATTQIQESGNADVATNATAPAEPRIVIDAPKEPVPSGRTLNVAREQVRDLFLEEYSEAARKTSTLRPFILKLITTSTHDDISSAERYVLLDTAKEASIRAGLVDTALQALSRLALLYEVDEHKLNVDAISRLSPTAKDAEQRRLVKEQAEAMGRSAFQNDNYSVARRMAAIMVKAAKQLGDTTLKMDTSEFEDTINAARELYYAAQDAHKKLEANPDDKAAATALGKYLCFVKDKWDDGLSILANGYDRSLRLTAQMELRSPTDPDEQAELGNLWWKESEGDEISSMEELAMRKRAAFWYEKALPSLPAGLQRVQVEKRLSEVD